MTSSAVSDLAPTGVLRAAINFGNPVLAGRDAATGEPCGISVDLARELARQLGVPVAFVPYDGAGKVVAAIGTGVFDVCFLAVDPLRAEEIAFTAPYAVIEGVYLVAAASPVRENSDVDRPGTRVGVMQGSAYDLFLARELRHASIVRAGSAAAVMDMWIAGALDVVAGVRLQLERDALRVPGLRMLPGSFMAIHQAMGTQRSREAGAAFLRSFIDDAKAGGFVARAFAGNRITGAVMAP